MAVQMFLPAAIAIAAKYFPLLATRLGGPRGGALAETVVQVAATAAGVPPGTDARQVLAALDADPPAAEALRLALAELDSEAHLAELTVRDRESARKHQAQGGSRGWWRGNVMLVVVAVGLVVCVLAVAGTFRGAGEPPLTAAVLTLITTIAGALLKMLSDAFAFEFGSSAGSKGKDVQIERFQEALIDVNSAQIRRTDPPSASPPRADPPRSGGAVITDGPVVAVGDAEVFDASDDALADADADAGGGRRPPRRRDFVLELRRMSGTA